MLAVGIDLFELQGFKAGQAGTSGEEGLAPVVAQKLAQGLENGGGNAVVFGTSDQLVEILDKDGNFGESAKGLAQEI